MFSPYFGNTHIVYKYGVFYGGALQIGEVLWLYLILPHLNKLVLVPFHIREDFEYVDIYTPHMYCEFTLIYQIHKHICIQTVQNNTYTFISFLFSTPKHGRVYAPSTAMRELVHKRFKYPFFSSVHQIQWTNKQRNLLIWSTWVGFCKAQQKPHKQRSSKIIKLLPSNKTLCL